MPTVLRGLIHTMRPRQWLTKNIFIFAAVVFDAKLFVPGPFFQTPLGKTIIGFVLLCLISSTIYIVNDIADVEADRQHPKKKYRPIPSGQLPIPLAWGAALGIGLFTLAASFALNTAFGWIIVLYAVLNLAYSFKLKHVVIIDVLIVAAGFVLRVAAGVPLVNVVRFSPWLYVCMALLALFLGFAKRRQERKMPFVLYGIFRYLYLVHVRGEIAPPDEVALKDRPLQIDLVLWALSVVLILYVLPKSA